MGYIPIFVALLGVIILYSVLTYNQIKPRKSNFTAVIDQMASNAKERKALILAQSENEQVLQPVAEELKRTSTDRFQSFKKESELIELVNNVYSKMENKAKADELKQINQKQVDLMKLLKARVNEYNTFIAKQPAKTVATVFGFKTF